ncbi:PAS domain S-box protein [Roseivirga sp. UBA1976]|uniref:PAS domain-containing protein n=1 Tax=Roseivirga sp. UBA1976 TaxID=1947386 RepID=UPI002579BF00|nr:PAS domain S-box protein [Roseivirga sp. UBA1976]|tara:strand:- start:6417 stop:9443 length:3027 start_codon:yes stop_codon:yes gene_type:complete
MENILKDVTNELIDVKSRSVELQSVINNLTEAIWSIDLTSEPYEIIYHNNPIERFGNPDELDPPPRTMEEWQQCIHPDDRERVLEEVVNALSSGNASYSYRALRKKDQFRYFRDRISVLYENEKPVRLDGITIDIDHIRRSRLNLELSQQRLKAIVDALPDPVFISTKEDGQVIFANEVLFKVYEMSPIDFLGKKVIQFYQNFEGRKSYIERLQNEGHIQGHELVLRNKKGESFWVSASTMPLDFQNQECFITILQDITDRKNLEKQLQESNERYQLAVEGTNDAIWEYDFHTKKSYLSPQFWEGMGLPPEENPLDDQLIAKYLHEVDRKEFIVVLNQHLEEKKEKLTLEFRLSGAENKIIWALFKAGIIYSDKGVPLRAVGSLSNITSLKEAQTKLRESEAKYKLISENSSDCICLQELNGRFVFVSPSSKDVLGYTPGELASMRLRDIITEEYLHKVSDTMLGVIQGKLKTVSITFQARHKNGSLEWLETVGGAILDDQGEPMFLQTSTRNVTDRVEAQRQLKESEERYKLITENSNDIVTLMDVEGNYVFITPSIKEAMGWEVDEVIGQNTRNFVHPEDLPDIEKGFLETLEKKIKERTMIFRYKHKNGSWRWMKATGGIILDEHQNPIYFRANKIDITDKKLTEERLKAKEEQYKLVSENSADVICLHKLDATFTFVSPSCSRLLGYSVEEKMELTLADLIHPDDYKRAIEVFEETAKNKRKNTITQYRYKKKNGEYFWAGVSMSAVLNSDQETQFVLTSTRDITEIVNVIEKERQLNKLKSSFISMASHEFRTPLTTIQSSNELISMYLENKAEINDNRLVKHVSRIRTELDRLNALLKDVFTLGRLDVGKTQLKKDITSLTGIVRQVILECQVQFKDRKVQLKIEGQERQLLLDSQLISHAISNLINNALKYSGNRKDPEVIIIYEPDSVQLKVKDYGIGIPKKDQASLFESFSRASNVGDIDGTGLGLVIVKQFIEMHGGTISFQSEVHKGTTFTIAIPNV